MAELKELNQRDKMKINKVEGPDINFRPLEMQNGRVVSRLQGLVRLSRCVRYRTKRRRTAQLSMRCRSREGLMFMCLMQMEQCISSLVFKGSIVEAITEAKRQKKLIVVYISGDNEDSVRMDKSTWSESTVAESVSKYCILLHISEGSMDAAQFSALYPQKSAPCIAAIGYNGVQLWQNEGFVSAEVLSSTLEKAWLSLHVQEATATFLTAALASRNSEQIPSEAHHTASRELGSSSAPIVNSSDDREDAKRKAKDCEPLVEKQDTCTKLGGVESHATAGDSLDGISVEQSDITMTESVNPVAISSVHSGVNSEPSLNNANQHVGESVEAPQVVGDIEDRGFVKPEEAEKMENEEADISDLAPIKSSDIHLNIRLPGGISLQEKFQPTSTLRMVKDHVDYNLESSIGSYDLAIPYPRKVFSDQDLGKTLSELTLLDRQALIVVPHLQAVGHHRGRSSLPSQSISTNATEASSGEGYFSFVRRVLSYVNPFSYLGNGGSANSAISVQESQISAPESVANSRSQGNFMGSRRSYLANQGSTTPSTERKSRPSSSGFGSNIHTLKHDEDDSNFSGRNAFWNGNSTEYGGDDDNK